MKIIDSSAKKEDAEQAVLKAILENRKYRNLGIPADTVLDLIRQAQPFASSSREVEKIVKTKMHNLVAPYLGDVDFEKTRNEIKSVFADGSEEKQKEFCLQVLSAHASTKERIPLLPDFYARLFAVSGVPRSILDLACALNPFTLPWMNLPPQTEYHAYDIVQPRVDLINLFLAASGRQPLAENCDILVNPPVIEADAAFFFKEAHRFDQRQKGCNRDFWQALKVKTLFVSLPTANLAGTHSKLDQHRRLVYDTLAGLTWPVEEIIFENEIVFCIHKNA